jgi:hypothetical protein
MRIPSRLWIRALLVVLCAALLVAFLVTLRWKVALYLSRHTLLLSNGAVELVRWPADWEDRYGLRAKYGVCAWLRDTKTEEVEPDRLRWRPHVGEYMWGREYVRVPLWIPFAPLFVLTVWAFRAKRQQAGHCACGYDLRASPHRCPECGRPVATDRAPGETVSSSNP